MRRKTTRRPVDADRILDFAAAAYMYEAELTSLSPDLLHRRSLMDRMVEAEKRLSIEDRMHLLERAQR